jgi:hypothetical protein
MFCFFFSQSYIAFASEELKQQKLRYKTAPPECGLIDLSVNRADKLSFVSKELMEATALLNTRLLTSNR